MTATRRELLAGTGARLACRGRPRTPRPGPRRTAPGRRRSSAAGRSRWRRPVAGSSSRTTVAARSRSSAVAAARISSTSAGSRSMSPSRPTAGLPPSRRRSGTSPASRSWTCARASCSGAVAVGPAPSYVDLHARWRAAGRHRRRAVRAPRTCSTRARSRSSAARHIGTVPRGVAAIGERGVGRAERRPPRLRASTCPPAASASASACRGRPTASPFPRTDTSCSSPTPTASASSTCAPAPSPHTTPAGSRAAWRGRATGARSSRSAVPGGSSRSATAGRTRVGGAPRGLAVAGGRAWTVDALTGAHRRGEAHDHRPARSARRRGRDRSRRARARRRSARPRRRRPTS